MLPRIHTTTPKLLNLHGYGSGKLQDRQIHSCGLLLPQSRSQPPLPTSCCRFPCDGSGLEEGLYCTMRMSSYRNVRRYQARQYQLKRESYVCMYIHKCVAKGKVATSRSRPACQPAPPHLLPRCYHAAMLPDLPLKSHWLHASPILHVKWFAKDHKDKPPDSAAEVLWLIGSSVRRPVPGSCTLQCYFLLIDKALRAAEVVPSPTSLVPLYCT